MTEPLDPDEAAPLSVLAADTQAAIDLHCAPAPARPPKPAAPPASEPPTRRLARLLCFRHPDRPPINGDVVRAVVRGTRRQLGLAQPQKTALEPDALRPVAPAIPADLDRSGTAGRAARRALRTDRRSTMPCSVITKKI